MKRSKPLARRTPLEATTPLERRKPIAQGNGLKRSGRVNPKRKTPRRGRVVLAPEDRQVLRHGCYDRADGHCEAGVTCGGRVLARSEFEWHHRKLRSQQGGDTPTNSLCLCSGCHEWVHAHPEAARANGWIVPSGRDPADRAVVLWDGRTVRLNRDLTYDLCFDTPTTSTDRNAS